MTSKCKKNKRYIYLSIFIILVIPIIYYIYTYNEYNTPKLIMEINVQEEMADDLEIFIIPHGKRLKRHKILSDSGIGKTIPLYSMGDLPEVTATDITTYGDSTIYAKYKDKYAIIRNTNYVTMGGGNTLLLLHVQKVDSLFSITAGYVHNPPNSKQFTKIISAASYFYPIEEYEKAYGDNYDSDVQELHNFDVLMSTNSLADLSE